MQLGVTTPLLGVDDAEQVLTDVHRGSWRQEHIWALTILLGVEDSHTTDRSPVGKLSAALRIEICLLEPDDKTAFGFRSLSHDSIELELAALLPVSLLHVELLCPLFRLLRTKRFQIPHDHALVPGSSR